MTFETLPVGHAFRFHESDYPGGVFVKVTPRRAREQATGRDYPISNFTRVASLGPTDLAGGSMRRKSMTFGQMPSFAVFEKAYAEGPGRYDMNLRGIDRVTAAPTRLDGEGLGVRPRTLYEGVKELIAIWDSNIDAPTAQWAEKEADEYRRILEAWEDEDSNNRYSVEELRENAGSLASSIMETLGFEWI